MNNSNDLTYSKAQDKDPELWELAKIRASFKNHLASYIFVNAFFWLVWYFSSRHSYSGGFPWPVWPMVGWGIGLAFHFSGAYIFPVQMQLKKNIKN